MRKLDLKLFRDLLQMKGQVLAIVLVIAAGVGTFVMSMCAYASLKGSKDDFYREYRFADVFSTVKRCPNTVASRIREISGVATVETRLMYDVLLDVPEMADPATARLVSIPDGGENQLNRVYISRGRMLETTRTGETVVAEVFADAHGLVPGDEIVAIINGKRQELEIVGIGLSPEYVIQIQPGSILPDNKRFGVFWMSERDLEAAFDMTGAFNNVTLKLAYGNREDEVIDQLDQLLEPYGSVGAFGRDQQLSDQYLSDELKQLEGMAKMAPAIFLSVASFLLNIVVSRIISQQRDQIAALKAFGYTNIEVGIHYLNLVLIISLTGTFLGTLFGLWMGSNMMGMYAEFYKFPVLRFRPDPLAIAGAFLLTTIAAIIGTGVSVHAAVRLPPAEAMRPEPPQSHRLSWLERLLPRHWLSPEIRMVIRNVTRKPFKASLSIVGIAMAVAVMILGNFSLDAMNYMMDFQFRKSQRQDLTVTFVEPATASVMYEMSKLDGVLHSETIRSVAARIHYRNRSRRIGIMGLEPTEKVSDPNSRNGPSGASHYRGQTPFPNPGLFRLLDANEREVEVPEFGLMLNSKLAELLDVKRGDLVTVEVLEDKRPIVTVEVTAIVEEFSGVNAYMNKQRLHSLLKESSVATGAFLKVDADRIDTVFKELENRPGVGSVTIKDAVLNSFRDTVAENILVMRSFIVLFAVVIAIGVVYNSARISLSERSRDLATMRVVGFTLNEVSIVLLGEIALFTVVAVPLGWLIGYGLAAVMVSGLDTENYRIPLVVSRGTFVLASVVVVLATLLSGVIVQRRIYRLDLVSVLKTRE